MTQQPVSATVLRSMRDQLGAMALNQNVNYKARKFLSGAVTRINDAIPYLPEEEDAAPTAQPSHVRRFEILSEAIRQAVESNDCILTAIDYGKHGHGWHIRVRWNFEGEYTNYIGYRSASAVVRDWLPPRRNNQAEAVS
jgi:hypothetical protein